jgi:hypothetical protein
MSDFANISPRDLYLDLLKKQLIGMIYEDDPMFSTGIQGHVSFQYIKKVREYGRDHPRHAHSMIGLRRMNNIQQCFQQIVADNIPGDLIETGVWRGGATIFMRGLLAAYGITDRTIWVADSFQGLPMPNAEVYPQDQEWLARMDALRHLEVSQVDVQRNFALYGLMDEQVRFLPGWFHETLPTAPITQLALLRLDGDLYESTWDVLSALYDKVAPGGFVIVDDYAIPSCYQAITDYRSRFGISEPLQDIDGTGVFWRRQS